MLKKIAMTTAVLGLLFSASAAADPLFPQVAPQSTVDHCVSQIAGHADYTGATRVRHEVESRERRSIGHELRIDTRVFGDVEDEVIREYATTCAVGHSQRPLTFRIREIDTQ